MHLILIIKKITVDLSYIIFFTCAQSFVKSFILTRRADIVNRFLRLIIFETYSPLAVALLRLLP